MAGFPKEVRRAYRTQAEIDEERFAESPVGRMIAEIERYAEERKGDVARGAETAALASLMVEKFGCGLVTASDLLGAANSSLLRAAVNRLVVETDPQYREHQQYRCDSRPAGLSITDVDGTNPRTL